MKKQPLSPRPLRLQAETLRTLVDTKLADVNGGKPHTPGPMCKPGVESQCEDC